MLLCFLTGGTSVTLLAFSESLQGNDNSNNVIDGGLQKTHGIRQAYKMSINLIQLPLALKAETSVCAR